MLENESKIVNSCPICKKQRQAVCIENTHRSIPVKIKNEIKEWERKYGKVKYHPRLKIKDELNKIMED